MPHPPHNWQLWGLVQRWMLPPPHSIEALSGNCAAALPFFDKADAEGGAGCAPSKYRLMCTQQP